MIRRSTGQTPSVVVADAGYWGTDTITEINDDDTRPDVLVATGRTTPSDPPDPLREPDLDPHRHAVAAHNEVFDAEWQRRVPVIERVVNGEITQMQAATELALSNKTVSAITKQWRQGGGAEAIRLQRINGKRRPKPPRGPTVTQRAKHAMDQRLAAPCGRSIYRQRQGLIEGVFDDIKTNRRIDRFLRRGLDKVRTEWTWILTGHNLTIIHSNTT